MSFQGAPPNKLPSIIARLGNDAADLRFLPQVVSEAAALEQGFHFVIGLRPEGLRVWRPLGRERPLGVEFTSGKQGFRLGADRVRHERLIKALGKPAEGMPQILDATAGLGRDSALMAMAGYQVTMAEQSPIVHALLEDGLSRAPVPLARMMTLLPAGDAFAGAAARSCDAVYLDPMFPSRDKSAAVKKDLQWLQWLCPEPTTDDEKSMLEGALLAARKRVVVKRPSKAAPLAQRLPHHSLPGKTVRFDIYLP